MAKYQKYAEYQDSGVEWLGEIPSHWTVTRLKFLAKIKNGQDYKHVEAECGFPVMGSGGQFTFSTQFMFDKPSVLLGRKGTIDKPLYINEPFWTVDTMYYTDVQKDIDVKYFYYLAKTILFDRYSTNTALPSMTQENLNNFEFAIPSEFEERKNIRKFLDHETAKIDTLIAKQEKLIELLKEKRQAVISHTITKGLNPDVAMKDSGVEWLGQVPEHWEIPKLLHITTRIGDGLHSTPLYQEGTGYYFINGNNLVDGKIFIGETAKEVPESEFIKHQVSLDKTTVLLSINGTIGKVAQFNDEPVILGKSASYINCCRELLPNFLMNYLTSSQAKNYYDLEVTGTTIYNLSLNSIRNMKVPLPPIDEQKNIILFIAEQYSKYDRLIQSSEKQNQLLKERRTALISSAVTGKIDVRHHASRPSGNDKKQTEGI